MKTKLKHADVWSAFDLLREELTDERKKLFDVSAEASRKQNAAEIRQVLEFVEKLDGFVGEMDALQEKWRTLQGEIDEASETVREIVKAPQTLPANVIGKEGEEEKTESGTSTRGHCHTFNVTFADGTVVGNDSANRVFACAIEKLGAERVAALELKVYGDPLVTRDKSEIVKMPQFAESIGGGWFVKTQGNVYVRMETLARIAERLNEKIRIERIYAPKANSGVEKEALKRGRTKPVLPPDGVRVGKIAHLYFPSAIRDGKVGARELQYLLSAQSAADFKTGGRAVLKRAEGRMEECLDGHGYNRYYSDLLITYQGCHYRLTNQFKPESYGPLMKWLARRGYRKSDVLDSLRKKTNEGPTLFD